MIKFKKLNPPEDGQRIEIKDGKPLSSDGPIIPMIEGDGIGRDIMKACRRVVDAAVQTAYSGKKRIVWFDVYAGEKAHEKYGTWLPQDTLDAIFYYRVAIKGPLTTPVASGYRSLNVKMRQRLDLYACVRPVRYYRGVPSPVKHPEKLDVVIFRENTEDVYAGIEWPAYSKQVQKLYNFLEDEMHVKVRGDSGVGLKPISETCTKRLVRMAIRYAIEHKRKSVTLVHKGNIMKYTEGAFRDWGYKVAKEEFAEQTIAESELNKSLRSGEETLSRQATRRLSPQKDGREALGEFFLPREAHATGDMIVIKDRIADSMFQQVLTRPEEYDVIATPNLNGDYLSDACAAQVGGIGMAPGSNIGDEAALFEATHGTAPKYADKDVANPSSLILSAVMMLEHLGWHESAKLIVKALEKTILQKRVTYDLERLMESATRVSTSEFADAIIENIG